MNLPFRNFLAYLYSIYLIKCGKLKSVRNKCKKGEILLSVYFHNPSKKLFSKCTKWFIDNGFTFISSEDLGNILSKEKKFPKSAVVFTVDDGWKENKENIFSIAKKYQIPITLFATTQPIESNGKFWWTIIAKSRKDILKNKKVEQLKKVSNEIRLEKVKLANESFSSESDAITVDELIELSQSEVITIGSHTLQHPILPMCNDEESWNEISQSRTILQNWLNKPVTQFAYPNGDYTERESHFLKQAGYTLAFTTEPRYIDYKNTINIYQVPRFGVVDNVPFTENLCRMTGIWYERKNFKK